jgi:hypothetical protein
MKKVILISLLCIGLVSFTLPDCCTQLQQAVRGLLIRVYELEKKQCECCTHLRTAESLFYYPDQNNETLYLNDRFPLQDVCNGTNGTLVTADATIYCQYQDWNGGWTVIIPTHGGFLY